MLPLFFSELAGLLAFAWCGG